MKRRAKNRQTYFSLFCELFDFCAAKWEKINGDNKESIKYKNKCFTEFC